MARETNEEMLVRLMNFSKTGVVMQIFIMDSLMKMAKAVAEKPLEEVREAFGPNHFIRPDAWHAAATELNNEFKERVK
jgi:predicted small secreted protein